MGRDVDMTVGKKRLGDILVDYGLIGASQRDQAVRDQLGHPGRALGRSVIELGFCTEEALLRALSLQIGLPAVHVGEVEVPPEILAHVPVAVATELQVLPLAIVKDQGKDTLLLAMARPLDAETLNAVRRVSGMRVLPLIAGDAAMRRAVDRLYRVETITAGVEAALELLDPSLELSVARDLDIPEALQITPEELLRELG